MHHSRRTMLQALSGGFGYLALQVACAQPGPAAGRATGAADAGRRPRARRVIFLCMSGGPAHLDTFDYKPQTGNAEHPGSSFAFRRQGESGLWISELLPETARHADQLCVLNGMHADTGIHAQSFLQLHTGERLRKRPSIGAWVSYGLGSENDDLPAFISLNTSKSSIYSSAFLPAVHTGTPIGVNGESMTTATIQNITGGELPAVARRRQLDFVQQLNRGHHSSRVDDERLEGVIESMELGFRMQTAAPALLDLGDETAATLARYRVGERREKVGTCQVSDFGRQCLLARRFAEAGVRFIEVNHGSWDQHKNHRRDLRANCEATDAPIAALLDDLRQRGLLEDTLVVWGGEFGRPGMKPSDTKDETGHNHAGFTFWLAGGGVKRGHVHGATDPTGARAVDGRVHFRDLHATILHALGLSADDLTYWHEGRHHRLTGPEGGRVIHEIMA